MANGAHDLDTVTTVVLVEGESDRSAVEALVTRSIGRPPVGGDVAVVSIGGATNFAAHVGSAVARGANVAGLYDVGEEWAVRRALLRAGYDPPLNRADIEQHGFFVCDADLEDEMIRALGPERVEAIVEGEGELPSFRRFQRQPAQAGRTLEAQLHRFLGTRSGRKIRYGRLLAEALEPDQVPRPLAALLQHVAERVTPALRRRN